MPRLAAAAAPAELSLPELQRRIHCEAGCYGNGALALSWILTRLARSPSIRDRRVLGEYALWILRDISPHLARSGWVARLKALPLPVDLKKELDALARVPKQAGFVPGMVWCLLVQKGTTQGFAWTLRAAKTYDRTFEETSGLGRGALQAIQNAMAAVAQLRPAGLTAGMETFRFGFEGSCDGVAVEGSSIGFSAALAVLSALKDKPLPGVFASGALGPDGRARPIGHAAEKVKVALREHPEHRIIILPEGNRQDVSGDLRRSVRFVSDLDELVEAAFGQRLSLEHDRAPPDELLREIRRLCEDERRFVDGMRMARRAIARCRGEAHLDEKFHASWYLMDCLIHLGRLDEAQKTLHKTESLGQRLLRQRRILPSDLLKVQLNRGRIPWGQFDYRKAERKLRTLAVKMRRQGSLGYEEAKVLGTLGQVLTHARKYPEAEKALLEAIRLMASNREEIPREHMMLGDLYRRMGRLEAAQVELDLAIRLNKRVAKQGIRYQNAMFIHLAKARLWRARGRYQQVRKEALAGIRLNPPFHPRRLLDRELGVALWKLGSKKEARKLLLGDRGDLEKKDYDVLARAIANTANLELASLLALENSQDAVGLLKDAMSFIRNAGSWLKVPRGVLERLERAVREKREFFSGNLVPVLDELVAIIPW